MKILITGANGFIAKNLIDQLERTPEYAVLPVTRADTAQSLEEKLDAADFVFHLAGVNRPQQEEEFAIGNARFTEQLCASLLRLGRNVPLVFSSSAQANLDNPYGESKRQAEESIRNYAEQSGARIALYRLKNVFGKWSRPNYNSVVATFCYNIARDLPITISDPLRELEFIYIDDVVSHFQAELAAPSGSAPIMHETAREVTPVYRLSLGELAALIHSFRQMRTGLITPDLGSPFVRALYATYLSFLEPNDFAYHLEQKRDPRGSLAEFMKSPTFGQIFVSRTAPGITRGNHYHHTKTEKFLVLEGTALIRFKAIHGSEVIEYPVRGEDYCVVDIPPGYTHSLENIGNSELVTLFWASEIFDPSRADTYTLSVLE